MSVERERVMCMGHGHVSCCDAGDVELEDPWQAHWRCQKCV